MTVLTAPERSASSAGPGIFLAGGITRVSDWQAAAIELLSPSWPVIYNPRRDDFPIGDDVEGARQIRWEFDHLARADAILFWFSFETMQPISLFELGRWATTDKPIVVGSHPAYPRRFDIVLQLALIRPGLHVHDDLAAACAAARPARG